MRGRQGAKAEHLPHHDRVASRRPCRLLRISASDDAESRPIGGEERAVRPRVLGHELDAPLACLSFHRPSADGGASSRAAPSPRRLVRNPRRASLRGGLLLHRLRQRSLPPHAVQSASRFQSVRRQPLLGLDRKRARRSHEPRDGREDLGVPAVPSPAAVLPLRVLLGRSLRFHSSRSFRHALHRSRNGAVRLSRLRAKPGDPPRYEQREAPLRGFSIRRGDPLHRRDARADSRRSSRDIPLGRNGDFCDGRSRRGVLRARRKGAQEQPAPGVVARASSREASRACSRSDGQPARDADGSLSDHRGNLRGGSARRSRGALSPRRSAAEPRSLLRASPHVLRAFDRGRVLGDEDLRLACRDRLHVTACSST